MSKTSIQTFFSSKTLNIPSYQRDYAWVESNVDDLFEDVQEALETGSGHYLGTFILSQQSGVAPAQVVDGQQRLTTLTILLNALINRLEDISIQHHYRNLYIANPVDGPRLRMNGDTAEFFRSLLAGAYPESQTDGQERLLRAYGWIRDRVDALVQQHGLDAIMEWLKCIGSMEVLEFIERDEGKAIRMFQSVNDRGVPLSKMDIVKSLLVYYSNRYLDGVLDQVISESFGRTFRSFSRIKRQAAGNDAFKVRHMARKEFKEDDILRYHYMAFDATPFDATAGADYSATAETVLESFLKPVLKRLRTKPDQLRAFIERYIDDLSNFFAGLEQLTDSIHTDLGMYKLFVIQDLAATLYPLVIRLHLLGWLGQNPKDESRNLRELIEMVDMRVFKLRGTNPQADIATLTQDLPKLDINSVALRLKNFSHKFMSDSLMHSRLAEEDLYRNPGLQSMLLEVEGHARTSVGAPSLDLHALTSLVTSGLTVEHVLPQTPNNNIVANGFTDDQDYEQYIHRFGNLMLLEGSINSACNNRAVEDKMIQANLYPKSQMQEVKKLRAEAMGSAPMYSKQAIDARSKELAERMIKRWPIESVGT